MCKQSNHKNLLLPLLLALLPTAGYAACVSGIPATTSLTDNGNGTLTDNKTGLVWKKCSEGQAFSEATNGCTGEATAYNWKDALERLDTHSFAGHSDWRLPNIKELASITEKCSRPAMNDMLLSETYLLTWWSSSPSAVSGGDASAAWVADFSTGGTLTNSKTTLHKVRLVLGESTGSTQ